MATLDLNLNLLDTTDLAAALANEAATRAAADAAEVAARNAAVAQAVAAEAAARNAAIGTEATARAAADAAEASTRAAAVAAAASAAAGALATANQARTDVADLKNAGSVFSTTDTTTIPEFANDAAAQAGGVTLGGLYRTGSILKVLTTTGTGTPSTGTRSPVFGTNIANAVLGASTPVQITGLLPNETFSYSVTVNDPPTYTLRNNPLLTAQANASGVASVPATFVATNDFLKIRCTNPANEYNSESVKTTNATGNSGTANTIRGRPIISGGTVKTEIGTFMRGATMGLDEIGSTASVYTKNLANWTLLRNQKLNIIRLPFSLSLVGVSLSAQLAEMDVAVDNAAKTGMYVMPMYDWNYGQFNAAEMASAWPVVAARYKDRTHVLFEMQNEPHWHGGEYTSDDLDNIAAIYASMRAAAPNSLIGVLTPAAVETSAGILSAAAGLVSRGVDIGTKAFVSFHAYGNYTRAPIAALKAAYPCMMTETTSGGPLNHDGSNNEVFIISEMETLDISWICLSPRFGEVNNIDTPYSNDQETLTERVLKDLRTAGYDWTTDPVATTQPPAGTGEARILSVTGPVSSAVIGVPITMTITAADTATITWVPCRANWSWYGSAIGPVTLNGSGVCTVQWTPQAAGDRMVAWPTGYDGRGLESEQMPNGTVGGGGGGEELPQPNGSSVYQDFTNGFGTLSHIWGNTNALSLNNGIIRIEAVPGKPEHEGACGVMQPPFNAAGGFGYGFFEWNVRFFGSGPGPCALLWAADDTWPRGEDDMGELDGNGDWYCAHHYEPTEGESVYQAYQAFSYRDAYPSRGDLPRGQWVTVGTLLKPGYVEFFVDVGNGPESIGNTDYNATPMYADGGVNRVFGVMHRGFLLDTAIEARWCRWTPLP